MDKLIEDLTAVGLNVIVLDDNVATYDEECPNCGGEMWPDEELCEECDHEAWLEEQDDND